VAQPATKMGWLWRNPAAGMQPGRARSPGEAVSRPIQRSSRSEVTERDRARREPWAASLFTGGASLGACTSVAAADLRRAAAGCGWRDSGVRHSARDASSAAFRETIRYLGSPAGLRPQHVSAGGSQADAPPRSTACQFGSGARKPRRAHLGGRRLRELRNIAQLRLLLRSTGLPRPQHVGSGDLRRRRRTTQCQRVRGFLSRRLATVL